MVPWTEHQVAKSSKVISRLCRLLVFFSSTVFCLLHTSVWLARGAGPNRAYALFDVPHQYSEYGRELDAERLSLEGSQQIKSQI